MMVDCVLLFCNCMLVDFGVVLLCLCWVFVCGLCCCGLLVGGLCAVGLPWVSGLLV